MPGYKYIHMYPTYFFKKDAVCAVLVFNRFDSGVTVSLDKCIW